MLKARTEQEFNDLIKNEKEILCLFTTSWCPYCRTFKPYFDSQTKQPKEYKFAHVFLDDYENQLWSRLLIDVVPTVIYFENGKIAKRLDGVLGVGLRNAQLDELINTI